MRKLLLLAAMTALPQAAMAWGYVGHNMIGELATRHFPADMPAFLRGPEAAARIGLISQEPDTSRNAGQPHDWDLDPGHFLDVSDDMTILGGPRLSALPPSRRDYDTAMRAVNSNQYSAGFLPYNILEGYQQLVKDFALLRAYRAAVKYAPKFKLSAADRKAYARLLTLREMLTLRDLGYWAHFVEDAGQPMHVSVHYDGWGNGPNPDGYTTERGIHAKFESDFVTNNVKPGEVEAAMTPYRHCQATLQVCVQDYIAGVAPLIGTIYRFEKEGALDNATPEARAFTVARLAAAASQVRDMATDAWQESAGAQLGYKIKTPVADYESGKALIFLQSKD